MRLCHKEGTENRKGMSGGFEYGTEVEMSGYVGGKVSEWGI